MDIDLVVMWVDGSDPNWLAEKNKYVENERKGSTGTFLFRDYGLMKYWFRAVESYLPWFRKIHFVTWGHLPPFLDVSNPKLNIVNHQDFMPEGTLPCFNSPALEMNLFRIKDLAEHFVYFNDDMFVLKPMKQTDFFSKAGPPCCQFTEMPTIHKGTRGSWQARYINDLSIINQYFDKKRCQRGKWNKYFSLKYNWYDNVRSLAMKILFPNGFVGIKTFHMPAPFCKKTFETIWSKEPDYLRKVSQHKFRDYEDVNQWLAIFWQMAEGNFEPRRMNTKLYSLNPNSVETISNDVINHTYEMICLNDGIADDNDFPSVIAKITSAFDTILPHKCSFEK